MGGRGRVPGVTGPDNDQDQTTTTLPGHCVIQKFQDQAPTFQDSQAGQILVLNLLGPDNDILVWS